MFQGVNNGLFTDRPIVLVLGCLTPGAVGNLLKCWLTGCKKTTNKLLILCLDVYIPSTAQGHLKGLNSGNTFLEWRKASDHHMVLSVVLFELEPFYCIGRNNVKHCLNLRCYKMKWFVCCDCSHNLALLL